jgi:hypothetical protein
VEIVHHQEAAAQKKLSKLGGLIVGQAPMPDLHRV